MTEPIRVGDLREFRRRLRRDLGNVNPQVKQAHRKVSDRILRWTNPSTAPVAQGPSRSNRAAWRYVSTLRSSPTVRSARIVSSWPAAWGWEFGSLRFRRFPPWSGNQYKSTGVEPGYVVWAAIRRHREQIIESYAKELVDAFRHAYPHRDD